MPDLPQPKACYFRQKKTALLKKSFLFAIALLLGLAAQGQPGLEGNQAIFKHTLSTFPVDPGHCLFKLDASTLGD